MGCSVLVVNASPQLEGSASRQLVARLVARFPGARVVERDLTVPLPHLDGAWLEAYWAVERTPEQQKVLALSDMLIDEIKAADVLVFGVPMYNFSVPASLKAWMDLVARDGVTFSYTNNDPVGLLQGKRAFVVMTSGGVPVDGDEDFATPLMRRFLRFIGVEECKVIDSGMLAVDADAALIKAHRAIDGIGARGA